MMPGVGFNCGALYRNRFTQNEAEKTFFHDDHHKQYHQRERRGSRTRMTDFSERLHGNPDRCQQEHGRNSGRRDGLGFAMAIWMVLIGWVRPEYHPAAYDSPT